MPTDSSPDTAVDAPLSFDDLAASRRRWIEQVLRPWCLQAALKHLRQADLEWLDIAGRADANASLWTWAWDRFPELTHEGLPGVNETHRVSVQLRDGRLVEGFPDSRRSRRGMLVLVQQQTDGGLTDLGPFSIDDIASVRRCDGPVLNDDRDH
ncbi:MAG: hypothetical protein R3C19_06205 [Planctomycetaceae bacterium]